jgi:MFS family permease
LIAARCIVGVGEASFATLAPPYIRDNLKDESTINKVLGIFYTSIPVGAAIGYIWGGWMSDKMHWRYAFYLGAVPGFLLTYSMWTMKEPGHRVRQVSDAPFFKTFKDLLKNSDYRYSVAAYTAQTFALGGFSAWGPQYGVNVLNASLTESSFKMGLVTLFSGIVGTLIGAKWGDVFLAKGSEKSGAAAVRAFSKFAGIASMIATPFALWMMNVSGLNEFILAFFLVQTAAFAALAPANTAILASVPTKVAATAFAVSIFSIHAFGDVISPPLTGLLADHMPMAKAMLLLVFALMLSGIIWLYGARQQVLEQA